VTEDHSLLLRDPVLVAGNRKNSVSKANTYTSLEILALEKLERVGCGDSVLVET
jgi:hypothetical protein